MALYVGVDGGGTRVRAVLVDEAGAVVRRAEGPAGLVDVREPAAAAAVVAAVVRALDLPAGAVVRGLCCGLAGAGRDPERRAVADALSRTGLAAAVRVVTDAEAAMHDAFGADAGVLLVAGTGSIAWSRAADGRVQRVGGWGHLLGDEGSGYAIGLTGLRAVARAEDGRAAPTALRAVLLRATGCAAPEELVAFAARAAKAHIGALAPAVLQAASVDAAAAAIAQAAVEELTALATTAAQRAALHAPVIALAGGLIATGGLLRPALAAALRAAIPDCTLHGAEIDAARGAAALARAAA